MFFVSPGRSYVSQRYLKVWSKDSAMQGDGWVCGTQVCANGTPWGGSMMDKMGHGFRRRVVRSC